MNKALRAEGIVTHSQGISNILMTEWGFHLYYNIVSLRADDQCRSAGFPWNLRRMPVFGRNTQRGPALWRILSLNAAFFLRFRPSLTEHDENDIIRAFEKVHPGPLVR